MDEIRDDDPVIVGGEDNNHAGTGRDVCAYCFAISRGDVDDDDWLAVHPRDDDHRTRLPITLARLVSTYKPESGGSSYPGDHERRYEVALYVLVTNHGVDHDTIGGVLPAASATTARAAVTIADLVGTYSPDAARTVGILASRWIAAHERKIGERRFGA